MNTSKRLLKLDDTLRPFSLSIRWGEFRNARRYIRFRETPIPLRDIDALKDIRITEYTVLEKVVDKEKKEASVSAEIRFYHRQSGIVKTINDVQTWWYDDETEKWFLEGDLPDFWEE